MYTIEAYEIAKAEFIANRSTMGDAELTKQRNSLNAIKRNIDKQRNIETFKSGESVEIQTFLNLLEQFDIEYTDDFSEWAQNDIVTVSKTGYESHKITKRQANKLRELVTALSFALPYENKA